MGRITNFQEIKPEIVSLKEALAIINDCPDLIRDYPTLEDAIRIIQSVIDRELKP